MLIIALALKTQCCNQLTYLKIDFFFKIVVGG